MSRSVLFVPVLALGLSVITSACGRAQPVYVPVTYTPPPAAVVVDVSTPEVPVNDSNVVIATSQVPEWYPTPNFRNFQPMPLPELPDDYFKSDVPPGTPYVDPSIPGNEPELGYYVYPISVISEITLDDDGNPQAEIDFGNGLELTELDDPGDLLDGWLDSGLIDLGLVQDGNEFFVCYAAVYGSAKVGEEPRHYSEGPCEQG